MKRLMTILVMVVLIGIGTDVASAQISRRRVVRTEMMMPRSSERFPRIGGSRINLRRVVRTEMMMPRSSERFPRIGGYGHGRDRTLRRVTGYGGLVMRVLRTLYQRSANGRVLRMAERRQEFEFQQVRIQNNENQELQQRIRMLELELQRLQLQQ